MKTEFAINELGSLFGDGFSNDPSQDLLIHIARAYKSLSDLKSRGLILDDKDWAVLLYALVKAYVAALKVRKTIPDDVLDITYISKLGRIIHD